MNRSLFLPLFPSQQLKGNPAGEILSDRQDLPVSNEAHEKKNEKEEEEENENLKKNRSKKRN